MRIRLLPTCAVVLGVVAVILCFAKLLDWQRDVNEEKRDSIAGFMKGEGAQEEQMDVQWFEAMTAKVRQCVVRADGFIGSDPYRMLSECGAISSFFDLSRGGEQLKFDLAVTPIRISTNVQENAKIPLFWWVYEPRSEVWIAYADFTWERLPVAAKGTDVLSPLHQRLVFWETELVRWGYPVWFSGAERIDWAATHSTNLLWSTRNRAYVPSTSR